jgi:hypothetical protein
MKRILAFLFPCEFYARRVRPYFVRVDLYYRSFFYFSSAVYWHQVLREGRIDV